MSRLNVHRIPVLSDNYSYLIEDPSDRSCVIVDPGEAGAVIAEIERLGLKPAALWNTHHHPDHVAGNAELLARYGGLPVHGSAGDQGRVPELTVFLKAGDEVEVAGEKARVYAVPGHTRGHIAFHLPESGHLFCGDLLFGYSCGKVFEGTLEEMYRSVAQFSHLPDSTSIWCGHEYTLNNARFAAAVEPDNPALQERMATEQPPTIPLNLGRERRTSPFMRLSEPAVQAFTGKTEPAEVFAELRRRKDVF